MNIILAMDLSLSCPAFAVMFEHKGKAYVHHVSHIKTSTRKGTAYRLWEIYNHTKEIISKYGITDVVQEKGFDRYSGTTAKLRMVDGVVALCAYKEGGFADIPQIPVKTVKKAITGKGTAEKEEVEKMLHQYLANEVTFLNNDESDAVAVGISYMKEKGML